MNDYNMYPVGLLNAVESRTVTVGSLWETLRARQRSAYANYYTLSDGVFATATESRPVADCGGCGARDYRAGRCTYCGRQA